jgi:lysophospholipid acyltransferase (LPLAT)-like uncharacterized protein
VTESSWQDSRFKRLQVTAIAAVVHPLIVMLCWTLRWRIDGWTHFETAAASDRPPIVGIWHGRILPSLYHFRRTRLVIITSQNFDGEWIARILRRFGYGTARGSSSRNASGALRHMISHMRAGRGTAFTLDGPRGPARQAKNGAVWLAMATGSPILPCHVEADRAWTMRSWDRAQIPKPFSTVALVVGEPLWVDRNTGEEGLERSRRELEARLEGLRLRALALVGRNDS